MFLKKAKSKFKITGSIPCLSLRCQSIQNMSSVGEKPNLINAKPAIFEETLQKEQQKKRRPSQI